MEYLAESKAAAGNTKVANELENTNIFEQQHKASLKIRFINGKLGRQENVQLQISQSDRQASFNRSLL